MDIIRCGHQLSENWFFSNRVVAVVVCNRSLLSVCFLPDSFDSEVREDRVREEVQRVEQRGRTDIGTVLKSLKLLTWVDASL